MVVTAITGPRRPAPTWVGGRPGSNRRRGDHDPECCRYTTATKRDACDGAGHQPLWVRLLVEVIVVVARLLVDLSVPLSRPSASRAGAAVAVRHPFWRGFGARVAPSGGASLSLWEGP